MANPFDKKHNSVVDKAAQTNDLLEWLRLTGHNYSILSSYHVLSGKELAFSHKDCKFYVAARTEVDERMLNEFAPYLRWEFDLIEPEMEEIEEEVEAKTAKGNKTIKKVKKLVPTGRHINKFPPTTENILKKKNEILAEIYNEEINPSQDVVAKALRLIVPRLVDHESVTALVNSKGKSQDDRIQTKFARTLA